MNGTPIITLTVTMLVLASVVVVSVAAIVLFFTGQRMLWLVGGVAAWRAAKSAPGPGHGPTLSTYVILITALSWFARSVQ